MYIGHQLVEYFGGHMGYRRTDDLLLSTGADKGTPNNVLEGDNKGTNEEGDASEEEGVADANEEDELKPEPISQRSLDDARFRAYEPLPLMKNINLSIVDCLEFSWIPYKTFGHAITYHDVGVLEVGMKYPNKDAFLGALKWHNIKNNVNYYVTKSHSEKFEGKCAIKDERCKWKIMASY
ncbi:hypothetical protein PVK06_030621 [Gossypium arboreum]|uniref:Transposase MuDR plant domain-containing protein n=1 Tax=Gossypium arboreum TaxID=29729 RepID=A0ABR0NPB2_GOSAR|nr:hypothetical protein PVK06_030621 [Gossypium arboreum]